MRQKASILVARPMPCRICDRDRERTLPAERRHKRTKSGMRTTRKAAHACCVDGRFEQGRPSPLSSSRGVGSRQAVLLPAGEKTAGKQQAPIKTCRHLSADQNRDVVYRRKAVSRPANSAATYLTAAARGAVREVNCLHNRRPLIYLRCVYNSEPPWKDRINA